MLCALVLTAVVGAVAPAQGWTTAGAGSGTLVDHGGGPNARSAASGPAVSNPGPQDSFQFDQGSLQMTASGGAPPYTWSAVGLPNGLSINPSTGHISGVFLTHAPYAPTVTATDSAGHAGSVTFSWFVECC